MSDMSNWNETANNKKSKNNEEQLKQLFQKAFNQFTSGCGRLLCENNYCASNPKFGLLSQSDAIKMALIQIRNRSSDFYICDIIESIKAQEISQNAKFGDFSQFVERSFSSVEILEISFLTDNGANCKEILSNKKSAIDYKGLEIAYEIILKNSKAKLSLKKSISVSSEKLFEKCKKIKFYSILRVLIIILTNPLISDPENLKVIKNLAKIVKILPIEYKKVLVQYFTETPNGTLKNIVDVIHQYIAIELVAKPDFISKNAIRLLTILETIYKSNKISKKLSYKAFYSEAINQDRIEKKKFNIYFATKRSVIRMHQFYFIFGPVIKSKILKTVLDEQRRKNIENVVLNSIFSGRRMTPFVRIKVSRDNIIRDTLGQLSFLTAEDLNKPLRVSFKEELGVDEGGVRKEFFQLIVKQLFDPKYGMFEYSETTRCYWFNKDTLDNNSEFELIGTLIGLAIYNGVILNLHFPKIVYMKLLGQKVNSLEHLKTIDPELSNGLKKLLNFDGDVKSTYLRSFSIAYEIFGATKKVDLKPDGPNIALTNENRKEYVDLYVDYVLNRSVQSQFHHFYRGFTSVCNNRLFEWFEWEELELLVCGSQELDFYALQKSCKYQDGYTKKSKTIKLFWEVVHSMSEIDKKRFLFFSTGSDRVPISGLGDITLTISKNGDEQNRLPSAHTCFNHLLLPGYRTKRALIAKLKLAIDNSEGFGLH